MLFCIGSPIQLELLFIYTFWNFKGSYRLSKNSMLLIMFLVVNIKPNYGQYELLLCMHLCYIYDFPFAHTHLNIAYLICFILRARDWLIEIQSENIYCTYVKEKRLVDFMQNPPPPPLMKKKRKKKIFIYLLGPSMHHFIRRKKMIWRNNNGVLINFRVICGEISRLG